MKSFANVDYAVASWDTWAWRAIRAPNNENLGLLSKKLPYNSSQNPIHPSPGDKNTFFHPSTFF